MAPRIERYRILDELGQGGMSVVYRAKDEALGRMVAVKVLHDFLARQPEARQRFHREALAVAKLKHPNILEIFDTSGPDAEPSYLVTELLEGETLRSFVDRRGGVGLPELGVLLAIDVARALDHAHGRGVIHRDLKPENVMVTRQGELKLMDFGIAQVVDASRLTATGALLGSPAHMAPEVIDGHRPSEASDLFSFGTLLYWLTTRELPFDGPNPSTLFHRILAGQYRPPQEVEPRIGNGLANLIARLLELRPADRPPNAASVVRELEAELALVGLLPSERERRAFLADPDGYAARLRPELVDRLVRAAREQAGLGQTARSTDLVNRALAIDPDHAEANQMLAALARRARRVGRRAAAVAGTLVLLSLVAAGAVLSGPALPLEPSGGADAGIAAGPTEPPRPAPTEPAPVRTGPTPSRERSETTPVAPRPPRPPRREPPIAAASEPPDAGPSAATPDAAAPAIAAPLGIRIGGSFADVWLDGVLVRANTFRVELRLSPGPHTLEVKKPGFGRFLPRRLEVDAAGAILDVTDPPGIRLGGELSFPVPRSPEEARPDWEPSAR